MTPFFYRFEGLDLIPGNKTAGFVLQLEPRAFAALCAVSVTPGAQELVNERARERLCRAGLQGKRSARNSAIVFLGESACPRYFMTDPMFGASIGCDPESFSRASQPESLEWLGPYVEYTPHNTDTPKQALTLLVLAQTWAEWAQWKLPQT